MATAPPGAAFASSTVTGTPASASVIAAASPLGPLPITTACAFEVTGGVLPGPRQMKDDLGGERRGVIPRGDHVGPGLSRVARHA